MLPSAVGLLSGVPPRINFDPRRGVSHGFSRRRDPVNRPDFDRRQGCRAREDLLSRHARPDVSGTTATPQSAGAIPRSGRQGFGRSRLAAGEGDSMTNEQIAAFVDRHAASWNRHDLKALCGDHAEDGVVVSPMFSRVQGRTQICSTYAALFAAFPDWHLDFRMPLIDGSRVAVPFVVTATLQGEFMGVHGTGRKCEFDGVSLYE